MWVIYALNYTDKSAFSTAINFGMAGSVHLLCVGITSNDLLHRDLDLFYKDANGKTNTGRYSNTTTIYYVGFVTGVPILALCAQRYPTAKVCAMAVTAWGLVCMATAWCHSYPAAMVQRFFLGFCEAGVQPCFVLLLGAWYTKVSEVNYEGLYSYSSHMNFSTSRSCVTHSGGRELAEVSR